MPEQHKDQIAKDNITWAEFNNIDLKKLFRSTAPQHFIFSCEIEDIDCSTLWKVCRRFFEIYFELKLLNMFS